MDKQWLRQTLPLIAAVVTLVVGMVGVAVVLWTASSQLSRAAHRITDDDVPSLIAIESASSDLRQLQMLLKDRLHGRPGDVIIRNSAIEGFQAGLEDSAHRYLNTSVDPGEAGLGQDIRRSLSRFNAVVERLLEPGAALSSNDGIEHDLDDAAAQLDTALLRAGRFNAEHTRRESNEIEAVPERWIPIGLALGLVADAGAILAMGLTFVAIRGVRKATEERQLVLERKADELETFAGRIAHDLLSPLTSVSLAVNVAERSLTAAEDARALKLLARAESSLEQVRRLTDDLLEFARAGAKPPAGALSRVDQVIGEVIRTFLPIAESAHVALRAAPLPERMVGCSPGVLTSLLSNLVQNAIKHLGGSDVREVEIRVIDDGPEVRIEVADTGPGVGGDPHELFQPYVRGPQAHGQGIGLGLATVKRLAESHGGQVGVRSTPGHGSVFWFTLPRPT